MSHTIASLPFHSPHCIWLESCCSWSGALTKQGTQEMCLHSARAHLSRAPIKLPKAWLQLHFLKLVKGELSSAIESWAPGFGPPSMSVEARSFQTRLSRTFVSRPRAFLKKRHPCKLVNNRGQRSTTNKELMGVSLNQGLIYKTGFL